MDSSKLTPLMFGVPQALVGMLHLDALPGSPGHQSGDVGSGIDGIVTRDSGSRGLP